jgi:hypothetical protein
MIVVKKKQNKFKKMAKQIRQLQQQCYDNDEKIKKLAILTDSRLLSIINNNDDKKTLDLIKLLLK